MARGADITEKEAAVLAALQARGGDYPAELCKSAPDLSRATLNDRLSRLIGKGYARRNAQGLYFATQAGVAMLAGGLSA